MEATLYFYVTKIMRKEIHALNEQAIKKGDRLACKSATLKKAEASIKMQNI